MWISAAPATPRIAVPPAVDAVAVFKARCIARAHLYGAGELDLHTAVDELEAFARSLGINRKIGIDGSQAIMAAAFRPVRMREWAEENSSAAPANSEHVPNFSEENSSPVRSSRTPASTIDALLYGLRRGLSCLSDPGNRERLSRCDEAAIRKIATELMTWPGKTKDGKPRPWLPAWEKDDIAKLLGVWRTVGGSKT